MKSLNNKKHKVNIRNNEIRCPLCREWYPDKESLFSHASADHFAHSRYSYTQFVNKVETELCAKKIKNAPGKFKILSRRGTKVYGSFQCPLCGMFTNLGWHYRETNRGELTICCICKDKYRPARPPYKSIIKTAVETDRSRH